MHDVQSALNNDYKDTSIYYLWVHTGVPNALFKTSIINFWLSGWIILTHC